MEGYKDNMKNKMKRYIFLILLSISFLYVKGQDINQLNEMINESLIAYLENINKWVREGIVSDEYPKSVHIVVDIYPPDFSFNDSLCKMNTNRVSLTNMAPFKKKLKKGVNVIFLHSITLTENQIKIRF